MNKIVLITGVSREMGLGYETARQMKELGFTVVIAARDLARVNALASRLGVVGQQVDVTNEESIIALENVIDVRYGKLDVLINNAAGFFDQDGDPLSADMQFIKDAFDTNVLGPWRMVKEFYSLLGKSDMPRIVNVSSGAGSFGDPVFGLAHHFSKVPVYGVTKLALNGLTVKLATRLNNSKFKVNSVDPGFTATYPGTEKWGARPVKEGAAGIVWAATLPMEGPSGGFFRDGRAMPF